MDLVCQSLFCSHLLGEYAITVALAEMVGRLNVGRRTGVTRRNEYTRNRTKQNKSLTLLFVQVNYLINAYLVLLSDIINDKR